MKSKFSPEKIALVDYRVMNVSLKDSFESLRLEDIDFGVEFGYEMSFNLEEKLMRSDLKITLTIKNEQLLESPKAFFQILYLYKVENIDQLIWKEDDNYRVDDLLSSSIAAISYSTARGVVRNYLSGSSFQEFVLPIISPSILLEPSKNK